MQDYNFQLTRVGVFYDGNFFLHVSNYYNYSHPRRSRISIQGMHEFIKAYLASEIGTTPQFCPIVDAHYFRGRLSAGEANQRGDLLYYERAFDDILMSQGVTTHYLPVRSTSGKWQERDIDLWLALEAFEMAFYKRFDVLVLIASDSDFVPLVRKLNTLGTRVMVLGWDFEYTDQEGNKFTTKTSQELLSEVTYPVPMHDLVNDPDSKADPVINRLFVPRTKEKVFSKQSSDVSDGFDNIEDAEFQEDFNVERIESTIKTLKEGYGFINFPPNNVFFHYTSLVDYDYNDLLVGDKVRFRIEAKEDGRLVARDVVVIE